MSSKTITLVLDETVKRFTVPEQLTELELDICFNELKSEWQKQTKKEQTVV